LHVQYLHLEGGVGGVGVAKGFGGKEGGAEVRGGVRLFFNGAEKEEEEHQKELVFRIN